MQCDMGLERATPMPVLLLSNTTVFYSLFPTTTHHAPPTSPTTHHPHHYLVIYSHSLRYIASAFIVPPFTVKACRFTEKLLSQVTLDENSGF